MIKYIGSKRLLTSPITAAFSDLPEGTRILDVFSGTSRVGQALKRAGFEVSANDHNAYAHTIARCYVEADRGQWLGPATSLINELLLFSKAGLKKTETQLQPVDLAVTQVLARAAQDKAATVDIDHDGEAGGPAGQAGGTGTFGACVIIRTSSEDVL